MKDIERKIKEARPRLKVVSPLAAAIILGYGFTNLLLGIGLLIYVNPSPASTFAIITALTSFQFWGVLFFALGLFKLYAYYANDWSRMRLSLVIGLCIKAIWFIALFFRWLDGGSVLLLIIWFFFMYVQAMTYVHFIPNVKQRLK